jgi:hypothetical protein
MWARLWNPRHSSRLMAKPVVESVRLDSEPPAGLAFVAVPVRHKEPPKRQRQREGIRPEGASSL